MFTLLSRESDILNLIHKNLKKTDWRESEQSCIKVKPLKDLDAWNPRKKLGRQKAMIKH